MSKKRVLSLPSASNLITSKRLTVESDQEIFSPVYTLDSDSSSDVIQQVDYENDLESDP